ncbi:helix-turn-helix domain-containing protein [Halalkalibacter krulwichiae]|uniref:Helix-turn-helix domain protein n=1 Tax=Halalkalibacter krulwichiae TaxID=199441 RepID=A0A1X9ME83_9BACI|nr:helix-turn-helix domain-containing protein [Halalkalibacter krulwichiae]ARK28742.1 Helix-turn-helix domain protein [Halalkalibacter krulwichiae]
MKFKSVEDYPIILKVGDIAEIIGVSDRSAYEIMERPDFPLIRIGRQKRVQREAFFGWLEAQSKLKKEA